MVLVVGPVIRCWKKGLLIVICESAAAGVGFTIRYDNRVHMGTAAERCALRRCPIEGWHGGIEWSKDDPFLAALRPCGASRGRCCGDR